MVIVSFISLFAVMSYVWRCSYEVGLDTCPDEKLYFVVSLAVQVYSHKCKLWSRDKLAPCSPQLRNKSVTISDTGNCN